MVLLGLLQEVDELHNFLLCFLHPHNIIEFNIYCLHEPLALACLHEHIHAASTSALASLGRRSSIPFEKGTDEKVHKDEDHTSAGSDNQVLLLLIVAHNYRMTSV